MRNFYRLGVALFGLTLAFTAISGVALATGKIANNAQANSDLSHAENKRNDQKKATVAAGESKQGKQANDPQLSPTESEAGAFISALHLSTQLADIYHPIFEHGIAAILDSGSGRFEVYLGKGFTVRDFNRIPAVKTLSPEARAMFDIRECNLDLEQAEAVSLMIGSRRWADPHSNTSGTWELDPVNGQFVVTVDSAASSTERTALLALAPEMIRLEDGPTIADATD